MLLNPLTVHSPRTLSEALQLYSSLGETRLLAGGTFLLNSLKLLKKKGIKTPKNIISLKKIDELKGIHLKDNQLVINSMTVINDVFNDPKLTDNFSVLKTVCRNISTNPVRNMATVGGNLTSRYTWTELGAPLIALEAVMNFVGVNGVKEDITVEDFFKGSAKTDKILKSITINRDQNCQISYNRVKKLSDVDVPLLAVCIKTTISNGQFTNTKVSVNSGTQFARRDLVLEKFLNQSKLDEKIAQQALDHLDLTIYDSRGDDYKKMMFRASIKAAILELINSGKGNK